MLRTALIPERRPRRLAVVLALGVGGVCSGAAPAAGSSQLATWCRPCPEAFSAAGRGDRAAPDILVAPATRDDCETVTASDRAGAPLETCSLQRALEHVASFGDPTPGDGVIRVGVVTAAPEGPACAGERWAVTGGSRFSIGARGLQIVHDRAETLVVAGCGATLEATHSEAPGLLIEARGGPVEVSGLRIAGRGAAGVALRGGRYPVVLGELLVEGSTVGVLVADHESRVILRDSVIRRAGRTGVEVGARAGELTFELTSTEITENGANGGEDGVHLRASESARVAAVVTASRFASNGSDGLQAVAEGSASLDLTVTGSRFTGNPRAIQIGVTEHATLALEVRANPEILGRAGAGGGSVIEIAGASRAEADAELTAIVAGNRIGRARSGIGIDLRGSLRATLELLENELVDLSRYGVDVLAGDREGDAPDVHLSVVGNRLETGAEAILVESSRNADLCLAVSGNEGAPGTRGAIELLSGGAAMRVERDPAHCPGTGECRSTAAYLASANELEIGDIEGVELTEPGRCRRLKGVTRRPRA